MLQIKILDNKTKKIKKIYHTKTADMPCKSHIGVPSDGETNAMPYEPVQPIVTPPMNVSHDIFHRDRGAIFFFISVLVFNSNINKFW